MIKHFLVFLALMFTVSCASTDHTGSVVNGDEPTESAEATDGCNSPLGHIAEGGVASGFSSVIAQKGQRCQRGEITCSNGQWSGLYIYPSCTQQR